jgi:hypothetical protein
MELRDLYILGVHVWGDFSSRLRQLRGVVVNASVVYQSPRDTHRSACGYRVRRPPPVDVK